MSGLGRRPLDGRAVAILGGAGRMGAATADEVIGLGGRVVLVGRDGASLETVAASLGPQATTAVADAALIDDLRTVLTEAAVDHIVVAISASARASSIIDTPPDGAQRAFARFWASYNALHLAADVLRSPGSVTLLSGSSARTPAPGYGLWTALHGSIEALARAAVLDIAPIRVNVVSPGGIAMAPDRQLVERPNVPADIGMAIASLIANPAITGAVLDVDGGERKGTWSGG